MALHFSLEINNNRIGFFYAVRVSGGDKPDDINLYQIEMRQSEPGEFSLGLPVTFYIKHRYGNGAWVLLEKSMSKYRELAGPDVALM